MSSVLIVDSVVKGEAKAGAPGEPFCHFSTCPVAVRCDGERWFYSVSGKNLIEQLFSSPGCVLDEG